MNMTTSSVRLGQFANFVLILRFTRFISTCHSLFRTDVARSVLRRMPFEQAKTCLSINTASVVEWFNMCLIDTEHLKLEKVDSSTL
jgi:hypothetical protein